MSNLEKGSRFYRNFQLAAAGVTELLFASTGLEIFRAGTILNLGQAALGQAGITLSKNKNTAK